MYYLNLYLKPTGEIVLKQVKNRRAYSNWELLDTYIIYDHKLYSLSDWRDLKKTRKFNFWERLIIFIREL